MVWFLILLIGGTIEASWFKKNSTKQPQYLMEVSVDDPSDDRESAIDDSEIDLQDIEFDDDDINFDDDLPDINDDFFKEEVENNKSSQSDSNINKEENTKVNKQNTEETDTNNETNRDTAREQNNPSKKNNLDEINDLSIGNNEDNQAEQQEEQDLLEIDDWPRENDEDKKTEEENSANEDNLDVDDKQDTQNTNAPADDNLNAQSSTDYEENEHDADHDINNDDQYDFSDLNPSLPDDEDSLSAAHSEDTAKIEQNKDISKSEDDSDTDDEEDDLDEWQIPQYKQKIPKIKKYTLHESIYKDHYNDDNDHLATTTYDTDYKSWFVKALLREDFTLIDHLLDNFPINLNEELIKNMTPIQLAKKMNNEDLIRFLEIKNNSMNAQDFNDIYFANHKPSIVVFDWNNTLFNAHEGSNSGNIFEGAMKFLQFLKDQGIKLVIVSNEINFRLKKQLKELHVDNLFDVVLGVGDTVYFKPSKKLGQIVIEKLGGKEQNPYIWMVGDSMRDLNFALQNDFLPIGIKSKNTFKGFLNFDNYKDFINWYKQNF